MKRVLAATGLTHAAAIGALTLSLSACATTAEIQLRGPSTDVVALTGEWFGTYANPDLHREGTIWFRLQEGEGHAHGDVRMTPRGSKEAYRRDRPGDPPQRGATEYLSIRFVRVSGHDVAGVLEEYWDPECGCAAVARFEGRLTGNRLEGSFETRFVTGVTTTGRWRADRRTVR